MTAANLTGTYVAHGSYTIVMPTGLDSGTIEAALWAAGGGGGGGSESTSNGGGGGGGEYAAEPSLAVTGGDSYTLTIGMAGAAGSASSGGTGGNSDFPGDSVTVTAHGGGGGATSTSASAAGGTDGTGSTNTSHENGGTGGAGDHFATPPTGGGGAGSGGTAAAGNNGGAGTSTAGGAAATAVTGGGPGGSGGRDAAGAGPASGPGGGGGGGAGSNGGGGGYDGQGILTIPVGTGTEIGPTTGGTWAWTCPAGIASVSVASTGTATFDGESAGTVDVTEGDSYAVVVDASSSLTLTWGAVTASAALTVTPSFGVTPVLAPSAGLTVTPSFTAAGTALAPGQRSAALTVTPVFPATVISVQYDSAALTVTPSFGASPAAAVLHGTAALTVPVYCFATAPTSVTFTSGSGTWNVPGGITRIRAQCWGPGDSGAGDEPAYAGGGGGGGEYAEEPALAVTPDGTCAYAVGAPGSPTTLAGKSVTVTAHSGAAGAASSTSPGGAGGTGSSNTIHYNGGAGGRGSGSGGGGGSSAGPASAGNAGTAGSESSGGAGGTVAGGGSGGGGGSEGAGTGGTAGTAPGGGGGGGGAGGTAGTPGAAGASGQITISWGYGTTAGLTVTPSFGAVGYNPQHFVFSALTVVPEFATDATGGTPAGVIVNQWSGTVTQNPAFGPSAPLNQSVQVSLDTSGSGTGYPSAGNWLFCIAGWHQGPQSATLALVSDDLHQWWRPASPSPSGGATRTAIWYVPNIGAGQDQTAVPGTVYVAPAAYMAGLAVTVVEIAGLGPWDVVQGTGTAYAADAESLALSLGAPPEGVFILGAVTGDADTAGTAFAPDGWTTLETVAVTNGTDHTGDAVIAAACVNTPVAVSVEGTASAAENLSGMLLSVIRQAPSPLPDTQNPAWPYILFEVALGSGYLTPPDEMTWTAWNPDDYGIYRLRSWGDDGGIQYELGQMQTSEGSLLLDNPDGYLTPDNAGSPYYPDILPGTPYRMRAIPPASSGDERWYVHQRFAEQWPQSWDNTFRGEVEFAGNDPWTIAAKIVPTAYRAEVIADAPYAWWPCDDPAIVPLPTSLVNAAPGNSSALQITPSPAGMSTQSAGWPGTGAYYAYSSTQTLGDAQGWMYGDPDSAAWTQGGGGTTANGRYLLCEDPDLPDLADGVTVEGWWLVPWTMAAEANSGDGTAVGQPDADIVLWQIGNGTDPVACLFIEGSGTGDTPGYLQLTTWNGTTPTTTSIWTGHDIRDSTWFGVTVTLTTAGWKAWVNGGVVATASASATINSPVTLFTGCAGTTGNAGGVPTAANVTGIGNLSVAHLAVYGYELPAARIMAHYMAAYAGFGQLPAPQVTGEFTDTSGSSSGTYGPDGNFYSGDFFASPGIEEGPQPSVLAAVGCATGGGYTSGPSSPETTVLVTGLDTPSGSGGSFGFMWLTAAVPAAPAYTWYGGEGAGLEKEYSSGQPAYLYVDSYGDGEVPPAQPSALGDTVAQRIERLLVHGLAPGMQRAIDNAPAPVQAALDTGGQSAGDNIGNITSSDAGLLFTDNHSALCYWSKTHLAAQTVLWDLGPDVGAGMIPYEEGARWQTDPQAVINDIEVEQYNVATNAVEADTSGTGENQTIPGLTYSPSGEYYGAILASQQRYGPRQVQNGSTSYLQSGDSIQNYVNWLFVTYGEAVTRITSLTVDAAPKSRTSPQSWSYWLGLNVGDLISAQRHFPGQTALNGTWRVTHISRKLQFGEGGKPAATIEIEADVNPATWFS